MTRNTSTAPPKTAAIIIPRAPFRSLRIDGLKVVVEFVDSVGKTVLLLSDLPLWDVIVVIFLVVMVVVVGLTVVLRGGSGLSLRQAPLAHSGKYGFRDPQYFLSSSDIFQ